MHFYDRRGRSEVGRSTSTQCERTKGSTKEEMFFSLSQRAGIGGRSDVDLDLDTTLARAYVVRATDERRRFTLQLLEGRTRVRSVETIASSLPRELGLKAEAMWIWIWTQSLRKHKRLARA